MHALSLVVATKDRPDDLRKMLASLEGQIPLPLEILVVDSSSCPVEPVLREFPALPLRYLRHQPPSAAAQRNAGIERCSPSATLIGFADDDIVFEKAALGRMMDFWNAAGAEIAGAAFNLQNYPPRRRSLLKDGRLAAALGLYSSEPGAVSRSGWQTVIAGLAETRLVDWLPTTAVVFRRHALKANPFDNFYESYSYLEDLDLSYAIGRSGRLAVVAEAGFLHFPSLNGRISWFQFGRFEVRNRLHFVRKNRLSLSRCYICLSIRIAMSLASALLHMSPALLDRVKGNAAELLSPGGAAASRASGIHKAGGHTSSANAPAGFPPDPR